MVRLPTSFEPTTRMPGLQATPLLASSSAATDWGTSIPILIVSSLPLLPSTLNRSPHAKPSSSSSSSIAIKSWKSLNVKALTRTQLHYKINERNVEHNWNLDRKSKHPTLSLDCRKKKRVLPRLTVSRRRRKAQKMELRRRRAWWCVTRYRFPLLRSKTETGVKTRNWTRVDCPDRTASRRRRLD